MDEANQTLWLNGKVFSFADLTKENPLDFETSQRGIVTFIKQWLDGREKFEAQTSGATGEPKTIQLQRKQMISSARLTQEALGLHAGMTALLCLDPELIAGKMMMVRCMVTGMHLAATKPNANPLDLLPKDLHVDFAAMVPLQVSTIISSGKYPDFGSIGKIIIGGGAISTELNSKLQSLNNSFYATFGMTETLSHVAIQKLNGPNRTEYFEALKGVEFAVDERSCLIIHAGYISTEPVVTNDVVNLLSSTKFIWQGRWDNIINTGGIKLIPEVVEGQIASSIRSLGVSNRFFIASAPHESLGEEVVLVIEGNITEAQEASLLQELRSSSEKYKAPKRILYAPSFELTTMGKIKRKETLSSASPRPRL
jgi:O-succinylbenzoic acid--CoA ligase